MLSDKLVKIRFWVFSAIFLLVYPVIIFLGGLSVIWNNIFKKPKDLNGEIALITGSGNGLGKHIAIGLAKKGCHIAVVDIDAEAAEQTARELMDTYNIKSKAFNVDVTKYENIVKLSKEVEEQLGPVTILVNNAGIMTFKKHVRPTPEEIQNMINTNLTAHVFTIRVFMNKMRELGKGHIVAIGSISGVITCHRCIEYTATKFGVRGLMMSLRTELYATNADFINTTTVFPFVLNTNAVVDEIFHKIGGSQIYPSASGEEAAEAIIDGIVKNKLEVIIPSIGALIYRFIGLLPTSWIVKPLSRIISRQNMELMDNN